MFRLSLEKDVLETHDKDLNVATSTTFRGEQLDRQQASTSLPLDRVSSWLHQDEQMPPAAMNLTQLRKYNGTWEIQKLTLC